MSFVTILWIVCGVIWGAVVVGFVLSRIHATKKNKNFSDFDKSNGVTDLTDFINDKGDSDNV